jgi:hypothetical protein
MLIDRQIAVFTTLLAVATTIVAGAVTMKSVPLCSLMDRCEPGAAPDPVEVCPRVPTSDGTREVLCVFVGQVAGATCHVGIRPEDVDWRSRIGPRVPPRDEQLLVDAIRGSDIVNRLPRPTAGPLAGIAPPMPFVDPGQVSGIDLLSSAGKDRVYSIRTGCFSGRSFRVVIVDDTVELRSVSSWIS